MKDIFDKLAAASDAVSIDDAFEWWAQSRFTELWLASPWWYLNREDVKDKFLSDTMRLLRSDGRLGIVDGNFVKVESSPELQAARSNDSLTQEENDLFH